jgi:hypothetical protein
MDRLYDEQAPIAPAYPALLLPVYGVTIFLSAALLSTGRSFRRTASW